MLSEVPAWAAQDITLPLWAVLVLAAYSNRRIVDGLRRFKRQLPARQQRSEGDS